MSCSWPVPTVSSRKFTDPFDAVMAKPLRRKAVLDALARAFGNVTPGFKPLLGKNLPEAPKPGAGLRFSWKTLRPTEPLRFILLEKQGFVRHDCRERAERAQPLPLFRSI